MFFYINYQQKEEFFFSHIFIFQKFYFFFKYFVCIFRFYQFSPDFHATFRILCSICKLGIYIFPEVSYNKTVIFRLYIAFYFINLCNAMSLFFQGASKALFYRPNSLSLFP